MATPERDTVYTNDGTNRTVPTRESSSTGWFVGIIVALALLAIGYLIFSANSGPSVPAPSVNTTPAVTAPADIVTPAPMTEAPATGTETTPMAPATDSMTPVAPATDSTAPAATPAPTTTTPAPAVQ